MSTVFESKTWPESHIKFNSECGISSGNRDGQHFCVSLSFKIVDNIESFDDPLFSFQRCGCHSLILLSGVHWTSSKITFDDLHLPFDVCILLQFREPNTKQHYNLWWQRRQQQQLNCVDCWLFPETDLYFIIFILVHYVVMNFDWSFKIRQT